jgi:hypothetical protein
MRMMFWFLFGTAPFLVMAGSRSFTGFSARDHGGLNEPAVIENGSVYRLMLSGENARHLYEIIRSRTFYALHVGRMDVGRIIETARHWPAKDGPRIRVNHNLIVVLQTARPTYSRNLS